MNDGSSRALELPASRTAPRLGREFVRATLIDWDLAPLIDTAMLLASEVVTNAVVHGQPPSTLCVERHGVTVHISVTDGGSGVARRSDTRSGVAGGHGLALVATLAERWGSQRVDGGHEVWFDLGVPSTDTRSSTELNEETA